MHFVFLFYIVPEKLILVDQDQNYPNKDRRIGHVKDRPQRHWFSTKNRDPFRQNSFPKIYEKHIDHLPMKPRGMSPIGRIIKPNPVKNTVDKITNSTA